MSKIVVTENLGLNATHIAALEQLGQLTIYNEVAQTPEEWLQRCKGADIVCSGKFGVNSEKVYQLKKVFFSLPFVGVGFLDRDKLKVNRSYVNKFRHIEEGSVE